MTHRLLLAASLALVACGPALSEQPSGLPPYTATSAGLFDDTLASEIFDMPSAEQTPAQQQRRLRGRVTEADLVVQVRVSTVTRDGTGENVRYNLSLTPVAAPLKGQVSGAIEVEVGPTSPSFALVRSEDTRLVGRQLLLLLKRFDESGAVTNHFRGEAATPENADQIRKMMALDELNAS
ncbi:MAG: hypothetical protein H6718_33430 [Polyangiaceae bacterium]|nr:hypothetical protein [Myxococcales bacterium]MCB9590361.1 hypothetical protein [Polyangiaceae bacterium]MCB9604984.1 hypothetical protein [Polyangiaceae bacterium]